MQGVVYLHLARSPCCSLTFKKKSRDVEIRPSVKLKALKVCSAQLPIPKHCTFQEHAKEWHRGGAESMQ